LQRQADQEAAEAKKYLDTKLAKILTVARNPGLRKSGEIEVMAKKDRRGGPEPDKS
jgi:hypothetical protein